MKHVTILGATGSIGTSCLDVISAYPNKFKVIGLSTHRRVDLLYEQCLKYKPRMVCITGNDVPLGLIEKIEKLGIVVRTGNEGLQELASNKELDIVVNGLVGSAGLIPTLTAIEHKIDIAIANKEPLVMAGEIITRSAAENNVKILPVDSEHSAIFQCLQGENNKNISRIILTASGGPFQNRSIEELENVTLEEALNHPNWDMGSKITIDSATMMNKGLEVIEAHWLFGLPASKIDVIVHPQSIIHSMVEFIDGSIKAQMGIPDMKVPIQYALTYPDRDYLKIERLDFNQLSELTFITPDFMKFPACKLAFKALDIGGTAPAVLNGANEVAVQSFMNHKIKFNSIAKLVEKALDAHHPVMNPQLEDILNADIWSRDFVKNELEDNEILTVSF